MTFSIFSFSFLKTQSCMTYIFTTITRGIWQNPEGANIGFTGLRLWRLMRVSEWLPVASAKQIEHECSTLFHIMIFFSSHV